MRTWRRASFLVSLSASLLAIGIFGCVEWPTGAEPHSGSSPIIGVSSIRSRGGLASDEIRAARLAARRAKYMTPELEARLRTARESLTPTGRARIAAALGRAVSGRIHNAALAAADAEARRFFVDSGRRLKAPCHLLQIALASVTSDLRDHLGPASLAADDRRRLARLVPFRDCPSAMGTMSLVGTPAIAVARPPVSLVGDDTLSGEYVEYYGMLSAAVSATDGTPNAVASAVNDVMAAATAIVDDDDFEMVAEAASIASSSAEYWSPASFDYAGSVAANCYEGGGIVGTANCTDLCSVEYLPEDSCLQFAESMIPWWWQAWSDAAWDLVSHDVAGLANCPITPARSVLAQFLPYVGVGASVGRFAQIMAS